MNALAKAHQQMREDGAPPELLRGAQVPALPANDQQAIAPVSEATIVMNSIMGMARDLTLPLDRLEKLMGMHDNIRKRDAQTAFDAAFAAMQPEIPVVERRGKISGESKRTGDKLNQSYGRWEDISPAIMPVLAKHHFAIRFRQESVTDAAGSIKTRITCILSHAEGHREEAYFDLPLDTTGSKNNVQAYGSTASYGRRYSAMLALNIVTRGEDDDGNAAGAQVITPEQAERITNLVQEAGCIDAFLRLAGVPSISDLPAAKFDRAVAWLNQKKQAGGRNG